MAKQVLVQIFDDIDETPIVDGKGEHISFSVNGVDYEIDLNSKNAKEFHRKLDYYIAHGAKIGGRKRQSTLKSATPRRSREQVQSIREWAAANGYEVGARGRIPLEVQDAFNEAH
ncbi:Lsr2 family protein [Rhodococcus opacus]|uniref:histone-like nucleoid-structuring protein Lsr2 n=1 Tax=Rhodococcus opacus TaxID=37919 RepID=UPI001FF3B955|nr:Lsr2 family protein [Rhodococcus opacus]UOT07574.1 Lsr2 family protein [Rhodococcus opacus]